MGGRDKKMTLRHYKNKREARLVKFYDRIGKSLFVQSENRISKINGEYNTLK